MIAKRIPRQRTLVTSIAALLCTCFITCTAAMGQANRAIQFKKGYCVSSYYKTPIYFSDVFESNVPFNVDDTETPRDIANLFDAYLQQSYGYKSSSDNPVVCVFLRRAVSLPSEESKKQLQARYRGDNKQLVETVWKLSRQQAAALHIPTHNCGPHDATCQQSDSAPVAPASAVTPPVPPAPSNSSSATHPAGAAAAPLYLVCWSSKGGLQYFSGVFTAPAEGPTPAKMAFADFLKQRYAYEGFVVSSTFRTQAEAQAYLHKLVANAQEQGAAAKYTETGWGYMLPAGAAAPVLYDPKAPLTYCLTPSSAHREIYFSPATPIPTAKPGDLEVSFAAYLLKKYGFRTSPSCIHARAGDYVDYIQARKTQIATYRSEGYTIIETDWTYTPGSATPLPPASPAAAQTPAQSTTAVLSYVVCAASSPSKMTGYVSGVFPVTKTDDPAWTSAFTQFLRQKYSIPDVNFLGCDTTTLENAQLSKAQRIAGWRNRIDVVETGWTYGSVPPAPAARPATAPAAQAHAPAKPAAPGQPASTPSAPPAPSNSSTAAQPAAAAVAGGPPSNYGVCVAHSGGGVVYFSAPFKVTDRLYYKWQQAFGEFLQKKYQYGGAIGCGDSGSLAEAQGYLKKYDDALRPTTKIIETGWKYQ